MFEPKFIDGEIRLIGQRFSPRVHALKDFFSRSRIPYRWLDLEQDQEAEDEARKDPLLRRLKLPPSRRPGGGFAQSGVKRRR